MRRGDVFLAELDPTQGSEQAGTRPVIVVSRNAINQFGTVVVVVPVTGREHKRAIYPSQIVLRAGEGGLKKDSVALCEQVRAVSKVRLVRQMGTLTASRLGDLAEALKITLELD